jgi:hypothetical protein
MQINVLNPGVSFNKTSDTFSAELSDLQGVYPELYPEVMRGKSIDLYNPRSGKVLNATQVEVHRDPSGEDTYGWLYHAYNPENGRNIKFLFIND